MTKANRIVVRLDDETDRLLSAFAGRRKTNRADAVREAIKMAASDAGPQRVADHLEEIVRRLADMPAIAKNMLSLSAQMGDMAEANNANTDRIAGILKILLERTKQ
ncbi:ribbon-helix-helix protein, CopG family [Geobacter sp. FeAm09]|uniref:ribbon-helix-helix protein, CopG family n=1 Tax=Geobacter sp. FeAm09 TaxID=2597769 RepID=UPI0011ECEF2D|nr:ribbon-helix-helix protein, CopG family [Geobacter sp. FeAm09]QEM66734.1 ribbon-helix-helix protein, CopG family [Geobacter sp. FeAm09]